MAGSVGPYGACLHDGSEYTGVYAEKMTVEVGSTPAGADPPFLMGGGPR